MAESLKDRIIRMIRASGPMPLADYMQICLHDQAQGYYSSRKAIGSRGDFITAPEISQMFGELIGIWCASVWQAIGAPASFSLVEAGPGKGTLMADLLRAGQSVPGFVDAAKVRLIEASPLMMDRQRKALASFKDRIEWADSTDDLLNEPLILVANEFLDCLPLRQFVKSGPVWRERCVGFDERGGLTTVLGTTTLSTESLPPGHENEPDGAVFEASPAREAWVLQLAQHIEEAGGAALLIDYGHTEPGFGDTFQAMRGHAHADPFAEPGRADLTSHVNFSVLSAVAETANLAAPLPVTQSRFLLEMGLLERAGQLGHGMTADAQEKIKLQVERLAGPEAMGGLFKVFTMADKRTADGLSNVPPFSSAPSTPAD